MNTSTATRVVGTAAVSKQSLAQFVSRWSLAIIFTVLLVISTLTTSNFLTLDNLRAVLINATIVGIVAVAMTPMTLSGNMFSMGAGQSTMLASMIFVAAAASGRSVWLGAALALLGVLVAGIVQALIISLGLNPIVTTLAAGTVIYGLVAWLTDGRVIAAPDTGIDWIATTAIFGVPLAVFVFLLFTAVMWFFIERTTPGRQIVLFGANRETAQISGLSARTITLWAFVLMSIGMVIAGILSASELGQVTADNLSTLTIDAVAAVLVGGTAIQGGEGSPLRSAVGALIIVVLQNVMMLHGLSTGARIFGAGLLVLVVIALLHIVRGRTQ